MNNIILSHNDMDGFGCVLSARKFDKNISLFNVGYDVITTTIIQISNILKSTVVENIFITDLNFSEDDTIELYKLVKHNPSVTITYIDHHPYETERQHQIFNKMKEFNNFTFIHTEKHCATWIFYKWLLSKNMITTSDDYEKLMSLINIFDVWKDKEPLFKLALSLNDIFYEYFGDKFVNIMERNEYKLGGQIKENMIHVIEKKNIFFKKLESEGYITPVNDDILLFISNSYMNHMTIDYPGYKVYINVRMKEDSGALSVRLRDDIDNLKEIKLGIIGAIMETGYVLSSGGHDAAFGVTMNPGCHDKVIPVAEVIARKSAELLSKINI